MYKLLYIHTLVCICPSSKYMAHVSYEIETDCALHCFSACHVSYHIYLNSSCP